LRQLDGENIIYLYCSVAARRYWRFNPPQEGPSNYFYPDKGVQLLFTSWGFYAAQ
jgi:hypothetical protein